MGTTQSQYQNEIIDDTNDKGEICKDKFSLVRYDLTEILEKEFYLGSRISQASHTALKYLGISYILSITTEMTNPNPPEFNYLNINLMDGSMSNIAAYFNKAHNFILEAKTNNTGILVHCEAGMSRSATITISYLMKYKNMTFAEAFTFTKNLRPIIDPNPGFIRQLLQFESEIYGEAKSAKFLAQYIKDKFAVKDITLELLEEQLIQHNYDINQAMYSIYAKKNDETEEQEVIQQQQQMDEATEEIIEIKL